jgi:hypothetical protein
MLTFDSFILGAVKSVGASLCSCDVIVFSEVSCWKDYSGFHEYFCSFPLRPP